MTQPLLLAMPDSDIAPVTDGALIEQPADGAAQARREKVAEQNKRAKFAEVLFCLKGIELGYDVKWMQGNCKGYDIILERNEMRPMFVQVKHAFLTAGRNYGAGKFYDICNAKNGAVYSSTAYDVLAVYLWDRREWVLYSRAELGGRQRTTFTPPELRLRAVRGSGCDARHPNNWEVLNQVAESLTDHQKSFTP